MAERQDRRPRDHNGSEPWLTISRRDAGRAVAASAMLAGFFRLSASEGQDVGQAGGVGFAGRVIELQSGKPLEGTAVHVERSLRGADPAALPLWVGESTIRTDAEGRFRLDLAWEQVAEPATCIALRIRHPGFIHRKCYKVLLAELVRAQARGEEPFFSTIKLEKGIEYTGQVVIPGGKPAVGIPYWFENWTRGTNRSQYFHDDTEGETDGDGRIRLRTGKSQALAIYLGPPKTVRARFPYAPYQHFWGTDRLSEHPDVWVPTDLGRIVLSRGMRLSGRMVDAAGRPIAGQNIRAFSLTGREQHTAATEVDGTFSLGPLRPANYLIYGDGQDMFGGVEPDTPPLRRPVRVVRPVRVYLKEDALTEPTVLRELPTVRVELRFVDSTGRPVRGSAAKLWGDIPNEEGQANPVGADTRVGRGPASEINNPEPQETADRIDWSISDRPDADGRIIFPAPRGLRDASLKTYPFDDTIAYKTRLQPNGPLKHWGGGWLGVLDEDRQITVVAYRSPTVIVTVKNEDGRVPDDLQVAADFTYNGGSYGSSFARQPDGRYRGLSLMPDHVYEIHANGRSGEYIQKGLPRLNLQEGGSAQLMIVLRKRPAPPEVGKLAPSFSVRALDGRALSLDAMRGKTVLLHFWAPAFGLQDALALKAVRERFGQDGRFAMIGLCLSNETEAAGQSIRSMGLTWPQAVLRDRDLDPIAVDYGPKQPYKAFLIGPDGRLFARDLEGQALESAVAGAVAGN
jgi:hypothetical protein